jgi:hypothetical protein
MELIVEEKKVCESYGMADDYFNGQVYLKLNQAPKKCGKYIIFNIINNYKVFQKMD